MQQNNRNYQAPETCVFVVSCASYLMQLAGSPTAPEPQSGAPFRSPLD